MTKMRVHMKQNKSKRENKKPNQEAGIHTAYRVSRG